MTNAPKGIVELRVEVEMLRDEVAELNRSTKALVDAWNAANSLVRFVKVLASIAAAVSAIYFFVRHGFITPKGG
jgi:alkylhydroperoxidase/carboxymuconolactone decarboxylase family protein YurZ